MKSAPSLPPFFNRKTARTLLLVIIISLMATLLLHRKTSPPVRSPTPPPISGSPPPSPPPSPPNIRVIRGEVPPGEPLVALLRRHAIPADVIYRLIQDTRPVYDLQRIHARHPYSLSLNAGQLVEFRYHLDRKRRLVISKEGNRFVPRLLEKPLVTRRSVIRGTIRSSLFESIQKAKEDPRLADRVARLFAYDIDFNRDLREGDAYLLLFEKEYLAGKFSEYGPILYGKITLQDRNISIIRHTDDRGRSAHYHPDGRAVKKFFLRCPLPFMRISSSFGRRRHPVLKFSSRHRGIDLAAPVGTPVRSTAAGVVQRTGQDSTRGRYIIVRHPNGYTTHYYHLSRLQADIRPGRRVSQGQVIGKVGNTGLSTGPHLHYGIRKNRGFINPLRFNIPSRPPLEGPDLAALKARHTRLLRVLQRTRYRWIRNWKSPRIPLWTRDWVFFCLFFTLLPL